MVLLDCQRPLHSTVRISIHTSNTALWEPGAHPSQHGADPGQDVHTLQDIRMHTLKNSKQIRITGSPNCMCQYCGRKLKKLKNTHPTQRQHANPTHWAGGGDLNPKPSGVTLHTTPQYCLIYSTELTILHSSLAPWVIFNNMNQDIVTVFCFIRFFAKSVSLNSLFTHWMKNTFLML